MKETYNLRWRRTIRRERRRGRKKYVIVEREINRDRGNRTRSSGRRRRREMG